MMSYLIYVKRLLRDNDHFKGLRGELYHDTHEAPLYLCDPKPP